MDLKQLIQEYYNSCNFMQLATVSGDQPWLCTVNFVADDNHNLYWNSLRSRRHSKEIMTHSKVAVTIVKDTERKQALQITGAASEVASDELEHVNELYSAKFGDKQGRLYGAREGDPNGRTYWVVKPISIWFWDEVNFPDQPKQEYRLN